MSLMRRTVRLWLAKRRYRKRLREIEKSDLDTDAKEAVSYNARKEYEQHFE